jgi:serine protease AprX
MKVFVRSTAPLVATFALLGGLMSGPASAAERRSKLDKVLQAAASSNAQKQHRVIVRTAPGTRTAVKHSLQTHGDVIVAEHPSLDALTVTIHHEDLAALEASSSVLSVSADVEVTSFGAERKAAHAAGPSNGASRGTTDLLRASLGLDNSTPYNGSGVGVAVVDSGIEPNRDLISSIAGFWDFTIGSGVPLWPYDDYGHGTHVSGLIASDGIESHKQFAGIAADVRLFGLKVLDREGRGRVSNVIRALEWILANHETKGIHVVNLSLGHPVYQDAAHDPLVIAVENLVRAGLVVVVAAGNVGVNQDGEPGYAGITSPGNALSAVTVGAVDTKQTSIHSDDRVAFFSSRGPSWYDGHAKPDVVAPGVGLTSNAARLADLFKGYPQLRSQLGTGKGSFASLSGTSMAAAVTTGVVALMLDAATDSTAVHPNLAPNTVKALLQYTALPVRDDQGNLYDALTQGTGKVNPRGALAMIEALDTSVPVGAPWISPRQETTTTLGGQQLEWARSVIWNDTLVVNPSTIWVNGAQWGQCDPAVDGGCENIVWGTGFECGAADPNCENIVWGTSDTENIVWGTAIAWTTSIVWPDRILGMFVDGENIVWGTFAGLNEENIVWGTFDGENIVWGTLDGENIVWGTFDGENIVWGTAGDALGGENIVWGTIEATR